MHMSAEEQSQSRRSRPEVPAATAAAVPWKSVALPVEHGGWGLLGEPLVLGLALAPSPAGACLALAAVSGFLSRHPLRLVLMDRRRGVRYPRTTLAAAWFAGYAAIALAALAALAAAFAVTAAPFWSALVAAAPLALVLVVSDFAGRSRDAAAETAGGVALCGSAAAIALAGGAPSPLAFTASALLALRALTSVLFVRARLRLDRGLGAQTLPAIAAHVAAVGAAVILGWLGLAPWLAVAAFVVLLARAASGLSTSRRLVRPQVLGFRELGYGVLTLLLVLIGYRAGI
jgi:hypothetical protein